MQPNSGLGAGGLLGGPCGAALGSGLGPLPGTTLPKSTAGGLPGLGSLPGALPGFPASFPGSLPGSLPAGFASASLAGLRPGLPGSIPGLAGFAGLGALPGVRPAGLGLLPAGLSALQPNPLGQPKKGPMPVPALGKPAGLPAALGLATSKAPSQITGSTPSTGSVPAGAVPPGPVNSTAAGASAAVCTVYVGRISAEVSDDFVKMLLEKCGKVAKWNRAADPNTSKLTSFGFCDFEEPQGVWRALQFLHEKQLCDKRLLVKCEDKAKHTIEVWKLSRREELAKKRASGGTEKEEGDESKDGEKKDEEKSEEKDSKSDSKPEPLTEEQLEEELQKESKEVSDEITRLMAEKSKSFPELKDGDTTTKEEEKAEDKMKTEKETEAEASKAEDKPEKPLEKDADKDGDKKEVAQRPRERSRDDRGRRGASREDRERDDRKRKDDDRDNNKRNAVSRHYRPSRRERDRDTRVRERERDIEKEYEYRIREFERSEDKRIRAFKADLRDMEPLPELSDREKRKLIDRDLKFGDRDSDERDWKRHREDRTNERAREKEKDAADAAARQKEVEEEKQKREQELEEERRKKEEEEKKKKEEEEEKRRQERLAEEEVKRKQMEEEQKVKDAEMKKQQEAAAAKLLQSVQESLADKKTVPLSMPSQEAKVVSAPAPAPVAPPVAAPKSDAPEPKLKDEEMRRLIHQVPTDKAKAFAYEIDWKCVDDHDILEKKLRPWVKKKVTEYLGQEEQGMIDFIMRKVKSQTSPQKILDELEGFLDEEAENFTLKMWRMLIFEVLRVKAR